MPPMPGMRSFLIYSEIFFQKPTKRLVELYLGRLNQIEVTRWCSEIAAILYNNPIAGLDYRIQRQIVESAKEDFPWMNRLSNALVEGRVLVHEIQLGILCRIAAQHSKSGSPSPPDSYDLFVRLLLAVNELHGETHLPAAGDNHDPMAFLNLELQSAIVPSERLNYTLHRYNRFIEWSAQLPTEDHGYLPIADDFIRLIGISYEDYATACFTLMSHFLTLRSAADLAKRSSFMSLRAYLAPLKDGKPLEHWVRRFAVPIDSEELKHEITYRSSDLLPFLSKPLLMAEGDILICPVPALLVNAAGSGLYWTLFNAYKADGGDKKALMFSNLFGRFLEDYVDELLAFGLSGTQRKKYREITYPSPHGESKSADFAIFSENEPTTLIEVSKRRFNMTKTIVQQDAQALKTDLDEMIVKKVGQLDRSLKDLRAGLYVYPEEVGPIVPVVVTGQNVPGMLAVPKFVSDQLAELRPFEGEEAAEVTYLGIEEFESLILAYGSALDLPGFISERNKTDGFVRAQGVKNYLIFFRSDLDRVKSVQDAHLPGAEEYFAGTIMKTAERWGLAVDWDVVREVSGATANDAGAASQKRLSERAEV